MKNAKVVIGAGYGDEGKGLMTDYFCRTFGEERVVNVRFNGGAQAGHTVVCKDGRRHVFSHFGSGSFNPNVITCLDKEFILNPILFRTEFDKLSELGMQNLPYIHEKCKVTLPSDMMINQMIETQRGDRRHGSCGIGINETIVRNDTWGFLPISEFFDKGVDEIVKMLCSDDDYLIFDYTDSRIKELHLNTDGCKYLFDKRILYSFAYDIVYLIQNSVMYNDYCDILKEYDNFVFEGAQGLQLDMTKGVNTTPSRTGVSNILHWLISGDFDAEVCYTTRSYLTRHGAGPLKTENRMEDIYSGIQADKTNVTNEFQGSFRYGHFDECLFYEGLMEEMRYIRWIKGGPKTHVTVGFAVTHLDETNDKIIVADGDRPVLWLYDEGMRRGFNPEFVYCSYGETAENVRPLLRTFRVSQFIWDAL